MSWFGNAKQKLATEEKNLNFAKQEGDGTGIWNALQKIITIKTRIKQEEENPSTKRP